MTVLERLNALRDLMREKKIDAYLVPTDDFHASEYVGDYFKCQKVYYRIYGISGNGCDHAGYGRSVDGWKIFSAGCRPA